MKDLLGDMRAYCASAGLRCPSRATLYAAMARCPGHRYATAALPVDVRACLYNLPDVPEVPGRQLAFYCFNYGNLAAIGYASSLPWIDLYQAERMRGWRERSRGLLLAAMVARGL